MKRRRILAFFLAFALICLAGCRENIDRGDIPAVTDKYVSEVYPTGPVRVIVPYAEGGGTDLVARSFVNAAAAQDSFPQGIEVENILGEGGATGMREGMNAAADGSVITTVTVELTTLPHVNKDSGISFDQFRPIMMVNSAYSAVTVRADSPFNTLEEFIEYSKQNPARVGDSGMGAIWHLASAGLSEAASTKFTELHFDGGSKEAIAAIYNNEVDAITVSYAEVSSDIESGGLKALAVLAPERLEEAPDVPTASELGYNAVIGTWRGFAVPKDTPDDICSELEYIMQKAVGSINFVEFMIDTNNSIEILNGEEFKKRMEIDNDLFKNLIAGMNL